MFRKKSKKPLVAVRQSQLMNTAPKATPEALNAAALAATKQQQSTSNLSSAAAAAALRSATSSPVPIGQIQTKRMVRRGSTSSFGSAPGGPRPGLQRTNSSGSMTERTFRSPSPTSKGPPPVPSIPKEPVPPLPRAPPIPERSHKRASSLEPSVPRVLSPTPAAGRKTPVPTTPKQDPANIAARLVARGAGAEPSPRPGSVNFSRPISPPPPSSASKTASRTVATSNQSPRGDVQPRASTSLGFSSTEARNVQQSIQKAANKPVKTKKMVGAAEGSHLANGAMVAPSPATNENASTKPSALKAAALSVQNQSPATPATKQVASINTTTPSPSQQQAKVTTPTKARPASQLTTPSPTQAQIEAFQARAAAMSARPLSSPSDAKKVEVAKASTAKNADPTPPAVIAATAVPNYVPPIATALTKQHNRSVSTPSNGANTLSPGVVRTASTSPARSAHFSELPVVQALKHQPPARAASPMKSAMKSSSRATSPAGSSGQGSRDVSLDRSDDGAGASTRIKRRSKVSFDEEAVTVGEAATPVTPDTPLILSPQNRAVPNEQLDDHGMTPRPALPSFGSVRDRKPEGDAPIAVGKALTADSASKAEPASRAISGVSAGTGELTEGDTTSAQVLPSIAVLPATPRLEDDDKDLGAATPITQRLEEGGHEIPTGSPVTADTTAANAEAESASSFYGEEDEAVSEGASENSDLYSDATEEQAAMEGDGQFASLDAILESPIAEEPGIALSTSDETANQGFFKGAAPQALAAAAVSAPVQDTDWDEARKYWSGLSEQKKEQLEAASVPVPAVGEEKAVPAVKKSAMKKTAPVVVPAATAAASQPPLPPWPDTQYQKSSKANTTAKPATRATTAGPKPASSTSEPTRMRKSMRGPPEPQAQVPDATHMRKSMRTPGTMQTSMRQPVDTSRETQRPVSSYQPAKAKLQKSTTRPLSAQPSSRPMSAPVSTPDAVVLARAIAAKQAAASPTPAPRAPKTSRLGRTLSNGSDESESSFRKRRGSIVSDGGGYSMKRSMRGAAPAVDQRTTSPTPNRANRLSLRALSPSGNSSKTRPRYTSRDSADSDALSLRSNGEKKSRFGFGKSKPKVKEAKPAPRFSSRFADSSDEEDTGPSRFRSRFADSDDDDDDLPSPVPRPQRLTPVRGIPRPAGQAQRDSTDLEDSDDEIPPVPPAPVVEKPSSVPPQANGSTQGAALGAGSLRKPAAPEAPVAPAAPAAAKPTKTKRGFFGFGRKEKAVTQSPPKTITSPPPMKPFAPRPPGNRVVSGSRPTPVIATTPITTPTKPVSASSPVAASPPATSQMVTATGASSSIAAAAPASPATAVPEPVSPLVAAAQPSSPTTAVAEPANPIAEPASPVAEPVSPVAASVEPVSPTSFTSPIRDEAPSSPTRPMTPSRSARFLNRMSGSPKKNETPPPVPTWPSPPPIPDSPPRLPAIDLERPNTSDGLPSKPAVEESRPAIGEQRISTMTLPTSANKTEPAVIVSSRTGKKKKFQGLRRAFGLTT